MSIGEKVAYLRGLLEGSDLKLGDKEKKVIDALMDTLVSMSEKITEVQEDVSDFCEELDSVCSNIDEIEEDLDFLFDLSDEVSEEFNPGENDALYDVECPRCHEIICIDEDILSEGDITCPSCGESLEFDFHCDCDECAKG